MKIFPPIPSEVILTFSGFMTKHTNLNIFIVILVATVGSILGAIILYCVGKMLNKERLIKLTFGKTGKILRIKKEDIEKADAWFDKKGNKTVLFCRCIPIIRSFISIPAGMSDMPFLKFFIYTIVGTIVWNTVLVIAGSLVGNNWKIIISIIDKYTIVTLIFLIILILVSIIMHIKRRTKN